MKPQIGRNGRQPIRLEIVFFMSKSQSLDILYGLHFLVELK